MYIQYTKTHPRSHVNLIRGVTAKSQNSQGEPEPASKHVFLLCPAQCRAISSPWPCSRLQLVYFK